jgi:IMP dehydrogenase
MKFRSEVGFTFDDVLLVPKRSAILSRSAVNTGTWLTRQIRLAIPIVSANMDTVTESAMAVAMAQAGGIGILHRFMPVEKQVEMLRRVKRAESYVVEDPITIDPQASILEARQKMADINVGGLVVVDLERHLLGMLSSRDVRLAADETAWVETVMTPRERLVVATATETLEAARSKLYTRRVEKLPLVDNSDRVVGLITARDIIKMKEHPQATKDAKGRLQVGAAVGIREEDMPRIRACVEADTDVLVLDVAHGHMENVLRVVSRLKSEFPRIPLIAGNVATAEGVRDLAQAGADAVKVGVGSGSICITRVVFAIRATSPKLWRRAPARSCWVVCWRERIKALARRWCVMDGGIS